MEDHDLEALRMEQVTDQGGPNRLPNMKRFNAALIDEYRASGGKVSGQLADVPLLLLTLTTSSGRGRTVPLGYTSVDGRLLILASKGGAPDDPVWYRGLVANPMVTVELGRDVFQALAVTLSGLDRRTLFAQVVQQIPQFAEYQQLADREIPMVELQRRA